MTITHFYTLDDAEAMAAMANMQATSEGDPFWAVKQSDTDIVPMYRMMHVSKGTHLFTTFIDERDVAVNENGYQGEGIGFWCLPVDDNARWGVQQLFRLYDPESDDHLYTLDPHESVPGYRSEGAACLVFSAPTPDTVPLFRLLSPELRHFYTADPAERQALLDQHYVDEGTCGNVMRGSDGALRPLFRSYNPGTGGHLYTLDIAEHDAASKNSGYRGDGISAYLWPDGAQPAGAVTLLRAYNKALDDHLYTTDSAEHANAVQNLGYADEGIVGWVLTPSLGQYSASASPVHRLVGNLAEDFLLLPPGLPAFLSSGSNFYLTSEIGAGVNPVVGLDVELGITADLTVISVTAVDGTKADNTNLGVQLNAYSPDFYTSSFSAIRDQPGWRKAHLRDPELGAQSLCRGLHPRRGQPVSHRWQYPCQRASVAHCSVERRVRQHPRCRFLCLQRQRRDCAQAAARQGFRQRSKLRCSSDHRIPVRRGGAV